MKTIYLFILLVLVSGGCTSKLIVQSEPQQADVYAVIEGKADRVKLGQTPMEITEGQLAETLKITPESSQWIEFIFEKKDFLTRNMMLPSNRWGEATKTLKVNLTPAPDQTTVARRMIHYFFNAKKFAESKQFEQAHREIDKVLEIDSKSSQALTMKAGIFFLQGSLDDAKKLYSEALALDPSSTDAIQMLEKIQNKRGQ